VGWLNTLALRASASVAECELSVLARQYLDRRIPDKTILEEEAAGWETRRNTARVTVGWQFTTTDARIKLKYWVRERIEHSTRRFESALASPKRLVRVAANSPATVEHRPGRETLRFSPLSCFDGVVIRLSDGPAYQLVLPFTANDDFDST
jgi:hypothetical protein